MPDRDDDRPVRRIVRVDGGEPDPEESVAWEIEHYVAERTDRLVSEGWDPDEARREAERRFGPRERYGPPMERMQRRRRRVKTMGRVADFFGHVTAATARTLRRQPGFAAGVALTLGLGVGANAAMFGIVDRLLLRPPDGIVQPDRVRLVAITRGFDGREWTQHSLTFPDILDLEEHSGLAGIAGYARVRDVTLGSGPEAVSVRARLAAHDFFDVLGVEPVLGRFPTADEDRIGAEGTVVLSYEYWQRAAAGEREVLGRVLDVSGDPYTVVGVAPRGFTGVDLSPVDLWLPLETAEAALTGETSWRESRSSWWVLAAARLADGVTLEAAEGQATGIHLAAGGDERNQARRADENARISLTPLVAAEATPEARVAKWLLGVSAVVLLIACANVANLFLARGARRRRESAVRLAMGVSRGRLVLQQTLEAVVLAGIGGLVALALARWGGEALRVTLLPDVLFTDPVGGRVLLFTAGISLLAGLLAGIGPALQAGRADLAGAIGDESRGSTSRRSRARGLLVVLQAALSVVLLVGAGLFVRSLSEVRGLDMGLDIDDLLLARLETTSPDLDPAERTRVHREALERLRRVPGVTSAALTQAPLGWGWAEGVEVPGLDSIPRLRGGGPYYWAVDPGYLETVGLRIVEGRSLTPADDHPSAAKVAVVSRTMARELWPDASAVGQCLLLGRGELAETCTTVVGVAEDAARGGIRDEPYMGYYVPIGQRPDAQVQGLYVRTAGEPEAVAGEVARTLRSFSPLVRYARVQTLREWLDPQARSWSLGATMFSVFGALALAVAAVGLYSLLAFDVAGRRRELGIRIALGAARARLLRAVVRDATRLALAGVVLGLLTAWFAAPRVEDLLFDVSPRNPSVLVAVAVVLTLVAVLASLGPARKATRVDPMEALRNE